MSELREAVAKLYFIRWSSGVTDDQYGKILEDGRQFYDSLLPLFSQYGVVQLDKNQDFSPFAGIPIDFMRVHPL